MFICIVEPENVLCCSSELAILPGSSELPVCTVGDGNCSGLLAVGGVSLLFGLYSCGLVGLVMVHVGDLVTVFGVECGAGVHSGACEGCAIP